MDYASKNWVISLINKVKALLTANGTGIVESGSNSYGEYEIFKNGRIHMTGWGFITWTSGASYISKTVTLPYEVADATKIRPIGKCCGYKTTDPTAINDTTGQYGLTTDFLVGSSTTQITIRLSYPTAINNTYRALFAWDIWGTV